MAESNGAPQTERRAATNQKELHPDRTRPLGQQEASLDGPCPCCTPDPARRAALERLHEQADQLAVARWLHQLAPLTELATARRRRWAP